MLAFIEYPSSLSWSSDPRAKETLIEPPCGATESVEMLCLLILLADLIIQVISHLCSAKIILNYETKESEM